MQLYFKEFNGRNNYNPKIKIKYESCHVVMLLMFIVYLYVYFERIFQACMGKGVFAFVFECHTVLCHGFSLILNLNSKVSRYAIFMTSKMLRSEGTLALLVVKLQYLIVIISTHLVS